MDRPHDPPPDMIPIVLKGSVLLLTYAEFSAAVSRGKTWRRRESMQGRDAKPRPEEV
jgi:hypothetical protein